MFYKYILTTFTLTLAFFQTIAQTDTVQFQTKYGDFDVVLYDFTPHHKALFLEQIADNKYKKALFNRIVKDFVVQGGEHDEAIAALEAKQGYQQPRLAPEFNEKAFHKIGALGAGRDNNTTKASFENQIYFVVGKPYTVAELDSLLLKHSKNISPERRQYYLKNGGLPRLDNDYTVFGEITNGLDVILRISQLAVDKQHYPIKKVRFKVKRK